jgi:tRNA pseudouridine38-40 synthase
VSPHRLTDVLAEYAGTRTFAAFHERSSPVRPRTIEATTLAELGSGLFEVRIRGDRFARYLVRFLVGTAVAVAAGVLPGERVTAALEGGEKVQGLKAPAHGLILWDVRYPSDLDPFTASERELPPGLPENPPFQDLLGPP